MRNKIIKKIITGILCVALLAGITSVVSTPAGAATKTGLQVTLKASSVCVVIVPQAAVRSAANGEAKVIQLVKKGNELTVLEKVSSFYKVKSTGGKAGYIYGGSIAAKGTSSRIESTMVLATTTSTQDTGLLDVLVPAFEKKYSTSVKVISVGSGEALKMGQMGDADVVLVHSRAAENAFVANGYGVNRRDVMHNDFFIVGPKDDPAGITGQKDAQTAMKMIAEKDSTFISRGDKSGTNTKELSLWAKYDIKPQGKKWYIEASLGMGDTLMMAAEKGAYTLVDSGTWWAFESKVPGLKIAVQGDKDLFNPYGVIAVNPAKHQNIHYNAAMAFVNYITSTEGQDLIGFYKANGHVLFVPDAVKQ